MNLYFFRHGEPDYSTDSLTEKGHQQAIKLADAVKNWKFDEVYQSSMGRAQQTASYSAEKWGIKPVTLDWIRELCWGDMKGDAYAFESPWTLNDGFIKELHSYPVGNDWENHPKIKKDRIVNDLHQRYDALDLFLKNHGYVREGQLYNAVEPNDKNIAFFCHGGLSCALIAYVMNIPFSQFIAHAAMNVTGISMVSFHNKPGYGASQLNLFNDCKHLN